MPRNHPIRLDSLEIGGGQVIREDESGSLLKIPPMVSGYADAQLDDTQQRRRKEFLWSPPLRFTCQARASRPSPLGTLGFGFWNDPFTFSLGQAGAARRLPTAPRAVWFFYGSPPNNFAFIENAPGSGWKAMALTTPAIPSLILAPMAALGIGAAQIPGLRRWVIGTALRQVKADEIELTAQLDYWHQYAIVWEQDQARFEIDGECVLAADVSVPSRLGFVAWIDNQYAIVSSELGFRFGTIPTDEGQWLELKDLEIRTA